MATQVTASNPDNPQNDRWLPCDYLNDKLMRTLTNLMMASNDIWWPHWQLLQIKSKGAYLALGLENFWCYADGVGFSLLCFFYMLSTHTPIHFTSEYKVSLSVWARMGDHFNMITSTRSVFSIDAVSVKKHLTDQQWMTTFISNIKQNGCSRKWNYLMIVACDLMVLDEKNWKVTLHSWLIGSKNIKRTQNSDERMMHEIVNCTRRSLNLILTTAWQVTSSHDGIILLSWQI